MASKKKTPAENAAAPGDPAGPVPSAKKRQSSAKKPSAPKKSVIVEASALGTAKELQASPPAGKGAEPALPNSSVSERERVALLAYSYWEARGCQGGTPEEDWFRAENEIRSRHDQDTKPW